MEFFHRLPPRRWLAIAFGIAFVMPSMMTESLAPFPLIAGSAAALTGFFQMGGGFAGSGIGALVGDPVRALGSVVPADWAAVILPYYALLFVFAIPLLVLPTRALVVLAGVLAIGMPLLGQVLRAGIPVAELVPNLTFGDLAADRIRTLHDEARRLSRPDVPPVRPRSRWRIRARAAKGSRG